MKLKNVLKGHLAYERSERLTIIDVTELHSIYAGKTENWLKVDDSLKAWKKEIDNREVIKSENNCGGQLFIYIK